MKMFLIATSVALGADVAAAAQWQGEGKLYNLQRELISEYNVAVQIQEVSPIEEKVQVTVTERNNAWSKTTHCTVHKDGSAWTKVCDGGTSRGAMFDNGLGIDYLTTDGGPAYATNIIMDSKTTMRLFRTKLVHGEAQEFFVETLTKEAE
jgi:hypothetical protein